MQRVCEDEVGVKAKRSISHGLESNSPTSKQRKLGKYSEANASPKPPLAGLALLIAKAAEISARAREAVGGARAVKTLQSAEQEALEAKDQVRQAEAILALKREALTSAQVQASQAVLLQDLHQLIDDVGETSHSVADWFDQDAQDQAQNVASFGADAAVVAERFGSPRLVAAAMRLAKVKPACVINMEMASRIASLEDALATERGVVSECKSKIAEMAIQIASLEMAIAAEHERVLSETEAVAAAHASAALIGATAAERAAEIAALEKSLAAERERNLNIEAKASRAEQALAAERNRAAVESSCIEPGSREKCREDAAAAHHCHLVERVEAFEDETGALTLAVASLVDSLNWKQLDARQHLALRRVLRRLTTANALLPQALSKNECSSLVACECLGVADEEVLRTPLTSKSTVLSATSAELALAMAAKSSVPGASSSVREAQLSPWLGKSDKGLTVPVSQELQTVVHGADLTEVQMGDAANMPLVHRIGELDMPETGDSSSRVEVRCGSPRLHGVSPFRMVQEVEMHVVAAVITASASEAKSGQPSPVSTEFVKHDSDLCLPTPIVSAALNVDGSIGTTYSTTTQPSMMDLNTSDPSSCVFRRIPSRLLVIALAPLVDAKTISHGLADAKIVGEYRCVEEVRPHGRPAWKVVHKGDTQAFLAWTPRCGGRWYFSEALGDDDTPIVRSVQTAWTALPDEIMPRTWTSAPWGQPGEPSRLAVLRG